MQPIHAFLAPLLLSASLAVANGPSTAASTVEVLIVDYKFQPADLKIKAGSTVKWINKEKRTSHSVLFTGPGGFESTRFFPDESYSRKFDKPGSYPYTCGPHPEMLGKIEVEE